MDEFISRGNIKRFREQLQNPADEQQRRTLEQLLKLEEERLAGFERRTGEAKRTTD